MTQAACTACGCHHEAEAHTSPEAMELEAARATERGDGLAAAIWRARAGMTRAGIVHRGARREDGRQLKIRGAA